MPTRSHGAFLRNHIGTSEHFSENKSLLIAEQGDAQAQPATPRVSLGATLLICQEMGGAAPQSIPRGNLALAARLKTARGNRRGA